MGIIRRFSRLGIQSKIVPFLNDYRDLCGVKVDRTQSFSLVKMITVNDVEFFFKHFPDNNIMTILLRLATIVESHILI